MTKDILRLNTQNHYWNCSVNRHPIRTRYILSQLKGICILKADKEYGWKCFHILYSTSGTLSACIKFKKFAISGLLDKPGVDEALQEISI